MLALAACTPLPWNVAQAQRGMTVEDVLSIENLGTIALSPDGQWAAVTIQRSKRDADFHARTRLTGDDRADVWLVSTSTGERRRITDGVTEGCGYWAPSWSADGERLAMLSSQGDDNAHLFVWSRQSGTLERVAAEGIHVAAALEAGDARGFGFVWVDDATLLTVVVPADFRPFDFGGDHETQTLAPREWRKMERGREPSVSVLVSGPGARPSAAVATVLAVDVVRRRSTRLADVAAALLSAPQASLSPDGKHLALFETEPVPPTPGRPMTFDDRGRTRAGLVRVGSERDRPRWLDAIERPTLDSVRWAPDGSTLAALAPRETRSADEAVHLVDPETGEMRRVTPATLRVRRFLWLDSKRLLVQASGDGQDAGSSRRNDWWVLPPGGAGRNLTASMPEPPDGITRVADGILVAVAGGALWQIDPAGEPRKIPTPPIRALAAREVPSRSEGAPELVVNAGEGAAASPYRVTLEEGRPRIEAVPRPSPHAKVDAHWPCQHAVVFKAAEDEGVFAWATDLSTGRATRLAAINEHLAEVAPPRKMLIEYRGADGDALKGIVLLPHDRAAGKRYPVLTWIYAGSVVRDTGGEASLADKFSNNGLNMLPLVARGYAVLFPSIPLGPEGKAGDPMIDLPKGVIAAVDRLIDLGIADPERLAVGGHSYGGYSTFGVVAYTNRFKAAIASAGVSNLVSQFGTFDARFRYGETATEGISRMRWTEGGQGRMAATPHENLWRYLRNSPLYYADRVQTPLLIIQGDIDFVPLSQGEEFFSALYRQGKTARFLRYWGEGHSVESPANTRHMWQEIFDWLDTHLGQGSPSGSGK
jgi:dipeptidyl aminopeptidase/acylaminoacyl peptidase